jgi:hypothetical protein
MPAADFWLVGPMAGSDGGLRLHWLSPYEHGHCDFVAPRDSFDDIAELRDGRRSAALEDRWPIPVVQALQRLLARSAGLVRVRLSLRKLSPSPGMPVARAWHQTAFEGLTLGGADANERIVLERQVPAEYDGVLPATGSAVLLNTWFPRDAGDPDRVLTPACPGVDVRMGYRQVLDFLRHHEDLRSHSTLAVIAHGVTEQPGANAADGPFLATRDSRAGSAHTVWSLPSRSLPPLVMLLACSSDRLELVDYASGLLDRGARCVLVPAGRIDAVKAADFAGRFLQIWRAGSSVADALAALKNEYRRNLLDRLWLLGDGGLRYTVPAAEPDPAGLDDLPEDTLRHYLENDRLRRYATAALADRATIRSIQATGGLRQSVAELNRALAVRAPASDAGRQLQQRLDEAYPECSRVTRGWLANYLMGLSEQYDHGAMRRYRHDPERDRTGSIGLPVLMSLAAAAEAREGEYLRSARSLVRGFEILKSIGEDVSLDRLTLTGTIIDHLIDFNLPRWAAELAKAAQQELATLPGEDAEFLAYKTKDRTARAAFRHGRVDAALAAMTDKFSEARARGEVGRRELAWLVYMASWSGAASTAAQHTRVAEAQRAVNALQDERGKQSSTRDHGNDDLAYLLRALAAWHWAHPDSALERFLAPWVSVAQDQAELTDADPGPWGLLVGYLATTDVALAQDAWPAMRAHLLQKEYRLEVLGIEILRGQADAEHVTLLRDFQHAREAWLQILQPVLCSSDTRLALGPVEPVLQERTALEDSTLAALPEPAVEGKEALLRSGLVPM